MRTEPRRRTYVRKLAPLDACPVEASLAVIAGKWKVRVLYFLLRGGPLRFATLRRLLPGVSQQVLAAQLGQLVDDGILRRGPTHPERPGSTYELTAAGYSLEPILQSLADWGETRIGRWQAPEVPAPPPGWQREKASGTKS